MVAVPQTKDPREARRARILDAAARLFSGRPFPDVSMDDVAHAAGVGKPTLYRYFSGKDALFAAVFARVLDDLEDRLGATLGANQAAPECLRGMLAEIVPVFREHLVPLRYLGESEAAADQSRRRVFRERRVRIAGLLATAIERGIAHGDLRPVEARSVAQMLLGAVWSAVAATAGSDSDVVRTIADLLLHGLAAVPSAPPRVVASGRGSIHLVKVAP